TTWILPNGSTAAANTAHGDRPDSGTSGLLPKPTGSFLQYPLNPSGGDGWNLLSSYETKPTAANSTFNRGHHATLAPKLQTDSKPSVTLPAFTVDTTAPAAPPVTNPPAPVTINAASFAIAGTATDNVQLAKVEVYSGSTLVGSQAVSGTSANFFIAVPL